VSRADERRAAIVAQQAAREKAEREARGVVVAPRKKHAFKPQRGPGRPPRPREES
jgi:hypothetical protein